MNVTAKEIKAIKGENLIYNGLSVMKTARHQIERGLFIKQDMIELLSTWIDSAQDWREGK